jgi:hypothetical protein
METRKHDEKQHCGVFEKEPDAPRHGDDTVLTQIFGGCGPPYLGREFLVFLSLQARKHYKIMITNKLFAKSPG